MNLTMRLTRMILIAVALAPLCAPADMPKGLFRGQMVSWEGSPAKGVLLARTASGIVEGCGYDSLSFLELSRQRITVAKLEPGDPLEIITDHKNLEYFQRKQILTERQVRWMEQLENLPPWTAVHRAGRLS